ncbi:ATP-binding protein [Actinophytocola sp.]|uniref:ATP-binding protein n=1 Tax=Actinophytocola sp. TaxID=1872138 RepID=UPI00389A3C05
MRGSDAHGDITSRRDERQATSVPPVASTSLSAEVNSFIGRTSLLNEAAQLLRTARLVTLMGAGGVGKTRLLERLAADLTAAGTYPDGVVIVRLAELKESDNRLESMIAEALGILDNSVVPGRDRLIDFFRRRRTLLMLDNCEHLVGDAGSGPVPRLVNTLLKAVETFRVVATSRGVLAVEGEHLLRVPPLCVGDTTTGETTHPDGDHEAVRLLIDRAAAVGAEIREDERPLATQLCQLLGGIPLAIELAAVQLDTMTLGEMIAHPDLLALLVDGTSEQAHHRTMRAALHWSHQLLTESEQRMWALVSVFEATFDLEAAQAVCRVHGIDEDQVHPLLARLVRKSVLLAERDGRTRYRMLEMIRQFGLDQVANAGMAAELRQAHATYFDTLAERATGEWFGPDEVFWRRRLRADLPNLRAAQKHFLSRPGMEGRALKLAINAGRTRFFFFEGLLNESKRMLELGLDAHPEAPSLDKVAALTVLSWIALLQGNHDFAAPLLAQAVATARELGIPDTSAPLLYSRGVQRSLTDLDLSRARDAMTMLAQAKHAFRADNMRGEAFMAELFLTLAAIFLADRDTAFRQADRLLATAQDADAQWAISWAWWSNALAELQYGDVARACDLAHEGLRIQREIGDTWGRAWSVWAIANIAVSLGQYELAAQLFGGAKMGLRQTHTSVLGLLPLLRRQQQSEDEARRKLGDEQFDAQVAIGDRMSWSEVVEAAFQLQPPRKTVPGEQLPGGLSEREFEVAGLVATGKSNRDIAERLGISVRTVEEHIRKINRKLRMNNRVAIAAWYLRLPQAS